MAEKTKCDFCMYASGCIGKLPDDFGRCIAFCVPKELSASFREFVAVKYTERVVETLRFLKAGNASFDDLIRSLNRELPTMFMAYHDYLGTLQLSEEVNE